MTTGDPAADRETLHTILADARAGRHEEAIARARKALEGGLEHALVLNLVAAGLERQGLDSQAEALLRRALELSPEDAACRNALGLCLLRLERPAEALTEFDRVLGANPALAHAHSNRASALLGLGRVREAEASFHRALELDERQGAALAGLARLASGRGAYPAARAWADKALRLMPGHPDAVMSLAASQLGEGQPERAESLVRTLLSDAVLAPLERAHAEGLLGDVLDAQHRSDEAFAAYSACNGRLRDVYAARFDTSAGALEYARAMTRHLRRAEPAAWRRPSGLEGWGGRAAGHIFVLGFFRSGTTLLEVVLEGHPQVVSLEENESLIDAIRQFMRQPEDLDGLLRAPQPVLESARERYWERVAEAGADVAGKVFVDKNPLNTLKLPLIARLFPQAKILFACRDPRDVVLSCFRHRFRISAPMFEMLTPEGAARYYDAVMQLVLECTRVLPLDICLVRHEDMVTAFAREMRRVCEFLGLEWAPAMGDFALRTQYRDKLTPSTAQLVRGLNTEGIGHWRRYREHLQPVLPLLQRWITQFYYGD